jgi:GNAT superfamily N-acetyltransferase
VYRKASIRPFASEDEPVLFGLAKIDRGADRRTIDVLERETVFVAEVGGEPAGYVALERIGGAVRVDQLFVRSEHEAEEVGPQLLEYSEGFAISCGANCLQVVVADGDRTAFDFYRERGFVPAGRDLLELVLPQQ